MSAEREARVPLAPWLQRQLDSLLSQRGHAWLLQGPSGLGQYPLGLALVEAWLCDAPTPHGACGQCASCHAVRVRTHPDLMVLMPETALLALGWPLSEKAQSEIDDKKRKASREIRVEAMREAVQFAQRTSSRGRGKAVLVYPAEDMNHITANALLKTLEEPPGDVRFVLASEAAHQLLPTIRSRCLTHSLVWPGADEASQWLAGQGLPTNAAAALLRAAGGRPEDALTLAAEGLTPESWAQLPRALLRGDPGVLANWPAARIIQSLQKICHDLLATASGAAPRYFLTTELPRPPAHQVLLRWSRSLSEAGRTADHPYNPGLMLEALVSEAQIALNSGTEPKP